MVDFHSHILPGVDDGSSGTDVSLKMLQMIEQQGIRSVVATPHFYANHDTPQRFLRRRSKAVEKLTEACRGGSYPRIYVGAEVHYFEGISDCDLLEGLTIADSNYLLVEMPHTQWSERHYRELIGLHQKRRITPVIAHIDRYISPFQTYGIPDILAEMPVLVQANADFFTRRFTRSMALRMLRNDRIHLLGSDCHNLTGRKPNLGEAVEIIRKRLGEEPLTRIAMYEDRILPK